MINRIISKVREKSPLVHCITNPISVNQCANAVLAVGARPVMAEHPEEVGEITSTADALVLNLGNITDVRMNSMLIAQKAACNIPVILDLVGVSCSGLRRSFASRLLQNKIDLMKGNYSEIMAMYDSSYKSSGVDSHLNNAEEIRETAEWLAKKYNTTVLASGKTDVITDGKKTFLVHNGTSQLGRVTGTGCMLGALCGTYMAVSNDIYGAVTACAVLGICGERSETERGNGTFMVRLIDNLSFDETEGMKIEEL